MGHTICRQRKVIVKDTETTDQRFPIKNACSGKFREFRRRTLWWSLFNPLNASVVLI